MTERATLGPGESLEQENAALRRRLADQAMASELLLGVLGARTELAAITGLIDLTEQLCSPAVSAYLSSQPGAAPILHPASPERLAAVTAVASMLGPDRGWVATDDGFAVRVAAGGQQLGTLVVSGVRFPEYLEDYVNLMITTAGVVGMAILLGRERQPDPSPDASAGAGAGADPDPGAGSGQGAGTDPPSPGFQAVMMALPYGVVLQDAAGAVMDCNPAAARILGFSREQLVAGNRGVTARGRLIHPDGRAVAPAEHPSNIALRTSRPAPTALLGLVSRAGTGKGASRESAEPAWLRVAAAPVSVGGVIVGVVTSLVDVTDHHREHLSLLGAMPPNPVAGTGWGAAPEPVLSMQSRAQLAAEIAAQLTPGGAKPALMLLDIDDFRSVNDAMGHEFGDRYLIGVAEAITDLLVAGDRVTRVGGDEFAIVVSSGTDPQGLAGRIRDRLAAGIQVSGQLVTAAASIGVAPGFGSSSAHALVALADTAMAQAKHGGGNQWFLAHTRSGRDSQVITMERELREALIADQLLLRYQPVFDLAGGQLVATEALVRWAHPGRGMVMPSDFIPVAERRHLIVPLGEWVLRRACRQAAQWRTDLGDAAPAMAVNISALQLGGHGLARRLGELLDGCALPATALCLEITETQLIGATDQVSSELAAIRALGVGVAIDDFGTGHAGFDYLRTVPADILKVDKSFIDGLGKDPTDTAIAASIITLGRNLGLTVVAEGVEEEGQLAVLRDLGCHQGQGWLWRPALQAKDAAALVGVHERHARA